MFCSQSRCRWYSEVKTGHRRKCYYEPQCYRGWLDLLLAIIRVRIKRNSDAG